MLDRPNPAIDLGALPRVPARTAPVDLGTLVTAAAPVVLTGLFEHWPALAAGRRGASALGAYLKRLDCGLPAPVVEAPAKSGGRFGYAADIREFSFNRRQAGVTETLDRIEALIDRPQAPFVAMQMLPLAIHLPDFTRENFLLSLAGVTPRLWIGGRVRTQTHNDRDHNLACVIAGRRRFLLFPPEQVANLYIGPSDNPPPLSLVDPEAPDLDRFPRYSEALAHAWLADLGPGDALFLPRHWWHHVSSLDPYNAMVNYWWGASPAGLENANHAFLVALLALKALPPAERTYWKAMFDAHVFAAEGDVVAHIPPELQGVLGSMSPALRASLKQQLRTAFVKS